MNTTHLKNFLLYISIIGFMCSCGSKSDIKGLYTDDLRYLPVQIVDNHYEEDYPYEEEYYTYVDTKTGEEKGHYEYATLFRDGCALVADTAGLFFIDHSHKKICGPYVDATTFNEGIAWVTSEGKPLTAINKKGKAIFEFPQAEKAFIFNEGLSVFMSSENGLWGVVDNKGKIIAEPTFNETFGLYINGLLAVQSVKSDTWGFINRKGELVIPFQFDEFGIDGDDDYNEDFAINANLWQAFAEGRIPVEKGGKWGVINLKGNYIINPQFDYIRLDGDNYMFRKDDKYGWCDKDGKYIINPQYDGAYPFDGGDLAGIFIYDREHRYDEKFGYINKKGETVIPAQFDEFAMPFWTNGLAIAAMDDEFGLIDNKGHWAVNPQFKEIVPYGNMYIVEDNSYNWGVIDAKGKYIVNPKYNKVSHDVEANLWGAPTNVLAISDYMDISPIVDRLVTLATDMQTLKIGDLCERFSLISSNLPKSKKKQQLYSDTDRHMSIKLSTTTDHIWQKVSDGWWGYNYVMKDDAVINSYYIDVEFYGNAAKHIKEITNAIQQKLPSAQIEQKRKEITLHITTK